MDSATQLCGMEGKCIHPKLPLPDEKEARKWHYNLSCKLVVQTQRRRQGIRRCYGLAADDVSIMIREYDDIQTDSDIEALRKWNPV